MCVKGSPLVAMSFHRQGKQTSTAVTISVTQIDIKVEESLSYNYNAKYSNLAYLVYKVLNFSYGCGYVI